MVLVKDSDTGGPSSITVRMAHLFAFHILCCVANRRGGSIMHEDWWGEAESLIWDQLKLYLFLLLIGQFTLCKGRLFLYCHVFLLPLSPFNLVSFCFPPSFVENKTEATSIPGVFPRLSNFSLM